MTTLTRRDLLRLLLLSAAVLPARRAGAGERRRVGIVGGGMAGVALAWLLDGERDVVLLEARESIGGNVRSATLDLDGTPLVVDLGAQYFHPGPYPLYAALLKHLGLFDPENPDSGATHSFPASITLFSGDETTPRFLSPVLPGRGWPLLAPWNRDGVQAFAAAFAAAKRRERQREDWDVTLGDWLPTLGLSRPQWEGMVLPWAASLFSGSIEQARGFSARAAMIFAAKALPANPLEPILYDVLRPGMIEPLHRLAAECSTVRFLTGCPVANVSREGEVFVLRQDDGRAEVVDDLVLAASGPSTLRLLGDLPGTGSLRAALGGIEWDDARIAIHTDPLYAPARPAFRSFLNCRVDGDRCDASMWLADVIDAAPSAAARVWKSWVAHRAEPPGDVLAEAAFTHMLPTTATIHAQETLGLLQGRDRIWLAGGYLHPYDSQETALRSALRVAIGLQVRSARLTDLIGAT